MILQLRNRDSLTLVRTEFFVSGRTQTASPTKNIMTSHPSSQDDLQLSGTYTANVLGTIRSHLEALQSYDVMALELIQNADDVGAREISFDVTDEALIVSNSAEFSYCGDLRHSPCQGVISHKDCRHRRSERSYFCLIVDCYQELYTSTTKSHSDSRWHASVNDCCYGLSGIEIEDERAGNE